MTSVTALNLHNLKDKVVVLTGGALGIGSELVRIAHDNGAHVFFGDVMATEGEALEKELSAKSPSQTVKFVKTDVTNYTSNVNLFETAYETLGRVDHALSAAGISERGYIVDPELTLETVKEEPKEHLVTLEVDLVGAIYFARVASVFLRQPSKNGSAADSNDKSLTFIASIAGITETPGLWIYGAAKHGVIGLMRCLRKSLIKFKPIPIRTNSICPWMTKTRLVTDLESMWSQQGLPSNTAQEVALAIAGVMADSKLNGANLYIEGGRAWETEAGYDSTMPQWMGEKQATEFLRGQDILENGKDWSWGGGVKPLETK